MMLCCFFFYICCSCHHLIITSFVYIYVSPLLSGTEERKRKKNDGEDRTGEAHKKPKAKTTHREDDSEFDNESGSDIDEDHILDKDEYAKSEEDSKKVGDEEEDEVNDGFVSSNGGDPDDSEDEDKEDETNTFKVTEYIKNDQKEFPLVAYAVEGKISIGLLPLSFFVHQNENFLFCEYTDLLSLVMF